LIFGLDDVIGRLRRNKRSIRQSFGQKRVPEAERNPHRDARWFNEPGRRPHGGCWDHASTLSL